jgi:hypothetical protein
VTEKLEQLELEMAAGLHLLPLYWSVLENWRVLEYWRGLKYWRVCLHQQG